MPVKKVLITVALCFCLLFSACGSTLHGTDELIEKAREEFSIADAENMEIRYAGLCGKDDDVLVWFISGNEYQMHRYLPMECEVVGENEYRFTQSFNPMDRGTDIAVYQWKNGYSFLVNNPDCAMLQIRNDGEVVEEIAIREDSIPFVYYVNYIPPEYLFLDKDGNEL